MNLPVKTFAFDMSPMSSKQISFKQMIPFPTKLIYKGKIQKNTAEVSKYRFQLKREEIRLNIRLKYSSCRFNAIYSSKDSDSRSRRGL